MPWSQVPSKFKSGTLHSGGPNGPVVKSKAQMVSIMLSEKKKAATDPEYADSGLAQALGNKRKKKAANGMQAGS